MLVIDVIATAHERSNIVFTTTLGFEQWIEVLGPQRLTGGALDRLTHRCLIVETSGESDRLHDAKSRRRNEPKS
ncbi:MAG: ATP-binding protein [Gemmataceae bacterium]|nr:ATP-binding protein [Gemmataceae bacterium]